ncbi:MAG: flagellar basal body-associated FliL family protein [Pseudomonadota bacterium]
MNMKTILIGVVFVLAVMGSSIGSSVYIAKMVVPPPAPVEGAEGEMAPPPKQTIPLKPPVYVKMEPFIVNFVQDGSLRYLQLTVELMSRDEDIRSSITDFLPQIRNELILLLSGHSYKKLVTREGKEQIREDIHREVGHIIGNDKVIESVYLTGFVMQ